MGWWSFFRRGEGEGSSNRAGADMAQDLQQLRMQARHRLIGAAVLVLAALIVFPMVFETKPRPIPADLPLNLPQQAAVEVPAPVAQVKTASLPVAPVLPPVAAASRQPHAPAAPEVVMEDLHGAGREVVPPEKPASSAQALAAAPRASAASAHPVKEKPATATRVAEQEVAKPAARPSEKAAPRAERPAAEPAPRAVTEPKREAPPVQAKRDEHAQSQERARALLEGRDPASTAAKPAQTGRYIVQIGAFSDSKSVQELRDKVERMGFKTYTQAIETAQGKRVRVRIGPYAARDEADKAAARLRSAGLGSAVLTL
ncbi:SPOR domain-containing protein [Roseateles sp. BYS180W]|uniref:SPOR domain-containing protein n=1 Tax=Roseateles rivi TaxID=3299028 RepID=A0ABW7FY71_9BURK